jgi:hypothetical protein
MFELDALFSSNEDGRRIFLKIAVQENDNHSVIITHSGFFGLAGKVTRKKIYKGKNIGKPNQTTHYEEACIEAKNKWNEKVSKGFVKNLSITANAYATKTLPMYSSEFTLYEGKLKFPFYVQPLINSIRLYFSGENKEFTGIGGDIFNAPEKVKEELILLSAQYPDLDFDGILFKEEFSSQDIIDSISNPAKKDIFESLDFWVFDIFDKCNVEAPFKERAKTMNKINFNSDSKIKIVSPLSCSNIRQSNFIKNRYNQSFDGILLKNLDGVYSHGKNSQDVFFIN